MTFVYRVEEQSRQSTIYLRRMVGWWCWMCNNKTLLIQLNTSDGAHKRVLIPTLSSAAVRKLTTELQRRAFPHKDKKALKINLKPISNADLFVQTDPNLQLQREKKVSAKKTFPVSSQVVVTAALEWNRYGLALDLCGCRLPFGQQQQWSLKIVPEVQWSGGSPFVRLLEMAPG